MKRMKNLNKKQHHKTVEAYLCGVCGTPDDCMFKCDGSFDALQGGIQSALDGLQGLSA